MREVAIVLIIIGVTLLGSAGGNGTHSQGFAGGGLELKREKAKATPAVSPLLAVAAVLIGFALLVLHR
jgi:hypothetical protein